MSAKEQGFVNGYRKPWSVDEVAEYLNISRRTVYRLLKAKIIPGKSVGGHTYFDPEKIAEYAGMGGRV